MANEQNFIPRLAAPTEGDPQPDPNASLGGERSSTEVADVNSSIDGVTSARVFADSSQAGEDWTGAFLFFLDTNLGEIREVVDFDTVTGEFSVDVALPATPLIGDDYWLFAPNGLFSSFGADACRSRLPRHRLIYMFNQTGAEVNDCVAYVVPIIPGPLECRIAVSCSSTGNKSNTYDVDDLVDENEIPILDASSGFSFLGAARPAQEFRRPTTLEGTWPTPFATRGSGGQASINSLRERPIWIQLSFPENAPIPRAGRAVYAVMIDSGTGAITPAAIVNVEIDGVPEEVATEIDRRPRIGGGARLSAQVRDSGGTNEEVPGSSILIEIQSGPGEMGPQGDIVQDPGEIIRRVYKSPDDPADAGATVTFDFEVI